MLENDACRVFIGYDPAESVAAYVLAHSIQVRASIPVSFTFINRGQLKREFTRPRGEKDSTEFSISRFLTPWLCGFEGWSLFVDCDEIFLADITELWELRDENFVVQVVKHNHVPKETVKFLGQPQSAYDKKNWSSVMLFNNPRCRALTPEYVNAASGLDLHQFKWLGSDLEIGSLPMDWNHLVEVQEHIDNPKILHYTLGGPYFQRTANCGYAETWWYAYDSMIKCRDRNVEGFDR